MRKLILLFMTVAVFSTCLFAAPRKFLFELQSWVNCPYCPNAQSGLELLFDELPDSVVPLTNYRFTPGHIDRNLVYGAHQLAVPLIIINGVHRISGGNNVGTVLKNNYLNALATSQALADLGESPFIMEPTLTINANSKIEMSVKVTVDGDNFLKNEWNRIYFALTTETSLTNPTKRFTLVEPLAHQAFGLEEIGDYGVYTHEFDYLPTIPLSQLRAISFIQQVEQIGTTPTPPNFQADPYFYPPISPRYASFVPVYQATSAMMTDNLDAVGAIAGFGVSNKIGPPTLLVDFTDISISNDEITSWEWDFGDGLPPTEENYKQNPTYRYTQTGTYSPKLTITSNGNTYTRNMQNLITVTSSDNVAGFVGGEWTLAGGPYRIAGDITIPDNGELIIKPGAIVKFAENTTLTVWGKLVVEGSENDPVTFTGITPETDWSGIFLPELLQSTTPEPTVFKYAIFDGAKSSAIRGSFRNIIVENCIFRNNISDTASAINLSRSSGSVISKSYFANNSSSAIRTNRSMLDIKNCLFVNNTGNNSAALFLEANSTTTGITNIINCTLYNNRAADTSLPYGTIIASNGTVNIINSIVNGADNLGRFPIRVVNNAVVNVMYSNIYKPNPESPNQNVNFGQECINEFPLFESVSAGYGYLIETSYEDWYLRDGSPCIDAGNPDPSFNDPADPNNPAVAMLPAKGTLRNDMGAFGGDISSLTPPISIDVSGTIVGSDPANATGLSEVEIYLNNELATKTGDVGEFTLYDLVLSRTYLLKFVKDGYKVAETSYTASLTPIDRTLLKLYSISGTVVDADDQTALEDVYVTITQGDIVINTTHTNFAGAFAIPENITAGIYSITFEKELYHTLTMSEVIVTEEDKLLGSIELTLIEVSDDDITIKPTTTALYANYPNPFNPSTTIQFSVSQNPTPNTQHPITIDIYNIKGQKVRSLVDGEYGAGVHSVVWNGMSDSGEAVGSGIYFYRMRAGDFTETKRMLLLK